MEKDDIANAFRALALSLHSPRVQLSDYYVSASWWSQLPDYTGAIAQVGNAKAAKASCHGLSMFVNNGVSCRSHLSLLGVIGDGFEPYEIKGCGSCKSKGMLVVPWQTLHRP